MANDKLAKLENDMWWIKWIGGGILGTCTIAVVSAIGIGIHRFGAMSERADAHHAEIAELRKSVDQQSKDIAAIGGRFGTLEGIVLKQTRIVGDAFQGGTFKAVEKDTLTIQLPERQGSFLQARSGRPGHHPGQACQDQ